MDRLGLAHRIWRAVPAAPRRAALRAAASLLAPRADATPPPASRGVVLGGEIARVSGLGEAARVLQGGLSMLGVDRGAIEMGILRRPRPISAAPGAALILHVNAPSLPPMLARAPRDFLRGRRMIGFWNWELAGVPAAWLAGAPYVHEIWAPSAFAVAALETRFPGRVRLVPYPLGALDLPAAARNRAAFGLAEDAVVVTAIAHLGASFARKNPLGAIAAHRAAFGGRADRVLVLKLAGGAAFPTEMARLRAAAGDTANIRLIDEIWDAARLRALLASTDILLSLHRAEGFGLVPAEAMLRGVAVIATGWSGNLQFMDAENAALVGHRLVAVENSDDAYAGPNAVWAEPDIGHAAELLRGLADDAAARRALAARGQAHARAALGLEPLASALAANGIS